jgi:hypothetical protein
LTLTTINRREGKRRDTGWGRWSPTGREGREGIEVGMVDPTAICEKFVLKFLKNL